MKTTDTGTLDQLNLIGRLLLTSDGTVTPMLEQIVGERMVTAGLAQSMPPVNPDDAALLAPHDGSLVTRTTYLVGATTNTVYVRAKSVFSLNAIPAPLRRDLLGTTVPIGKLLREHRTESFREILSFRVPSGGRPIEPSRRYLVFMQGLPAMLIEESFAAECFLLSA